MKLSKTMAQKIVKEMMNILPYNINVMNEQGIIIGSGEPDRIGQVHEVSVQVIAEKKTVEVFEETPVVKPGINEPILVNGEVIGVIGITGDPDVVRPFGKIVRVTAALLIEQSKLDEENHNRRLNRQKFYLELTQRLEYDEEFVEKAKFYEMDLTKESRVVLVKTTDELASYESIYQKFNHYVALNHSILFFLLSDKEYEQLLEEMQNNPIVKKICVGPKERIAATSLEKAESALSIGKKVRPSGKLYVYDELRLLISLSHTEKDYFVDIISNLDRAGNKLELMQTLQVYIEENGDINNIAKRMNIHRNTLTYRLDRIKQLTGRNPKNLIQLFELLCGLTWK